MADMLVLGDEALAMGAIDAGLSAAYGYPGTPSTEIMEFLMKQRNAPDNITAQWCANEKTAFETAVGVSYAGKRSLVTMKHVGLNVASDAFINSALLEIHGGLVIAVADDPGMHSSQNEQDSRFFADFAKIICLEPKNHQEIYNMTMEAFELSEKFHIPVMIRLVTRLSHSRSLVKTGEKRSKNPLQKSPNRLGWLALPSLSRKNWQKLLEDQEAFKVYSEQGKYNKLYINPEFREYGVITTGLGGNYFKENSSELPHQPSHLHIGIYPVPEEKIRLLADAVEKIIVIEEGYPLLERALASLTGTGKKIHGKLDKTLPPAGELNPDIIRQTLGLPVKKGIDITIRDLPDRIPQLCSGCPHEYTFKAICEALQECEESIVTSDIGCYALGALPPYKAVETILCMGASIGMAKGAFEAGHKNVIATIGDSTFYHSGIPPLIDAIAFNADITVVIMDNSTTAMTGGQQTILPSHRLEKLIEGLGVLPENIRLMNPIEKYREKNRNIIKSAIEYKGLSVVISSRECLQSIKKGKRNTL